MLERTHPKTAMLLADAKEGLLAFTGFPEPIGDKSGPQTRWSV
jgi:hypothetical protein